MQIYRRENYEAMSRQAADILAEQIISKPDSVLGLATGSSPIGLYRLLSDRHRAGELDFSRVTTVNLDEYKGLGPSNPRSYRYFMQENLFDHVNIPADRSFLPDGLAADDAAECARYDALLEAVGPIDLQLLGLGNNGHIGFNEPGDFFSAGTHCVALSESTCAANSRFFACESEVPRFAYTMGIGSIMHARRILLIVSGEAKAEILHKALKGPITPWVPASVLQLHRDVVVVGDDAALALF